MNIIVIISDTLRRDRLSFYRDEAVRAANAATAPERLPWADRLASTPNLDRLAARSTIFERYYAAAFPTMPTRADLVTGKWTFSYMTWEPLPRNETPLAGILHADLHQALLSVG